MPTPIQIVIDCADPHGLVRFWAAALGYEVEQQDEAFIRSMIEQGFATDDDVTEVEGRLVWREAVACIDPTGGRPRLLFMQVPEAKTAKNRVHLDLHVGEDARAEEVQRLISLGATQLYEGRQGPLTWITMADPEGNEFCVA